MTLDAPAFIPARALTALPGLRVLGVEAESELQVVEVLETGLETESVERLARFLSVSLTEVLERIAAFQCQYGEAHQQRLTRSQAGETLIFNSRECESVRRHG